MCVCTHTWMHVCKGRQSSLASFSFKTTGWGGSTKLEIHNGSLWRFNLSRVGKAQANEKLIRRKWVLQQETCDVCLTLFLFLIAEQGVRNMPIKPAERRKQAGSPCLWLQAACWQHGVALATLHILGKWGPQIKFQEQPRNAVCFSLEFIPSLGSSPWCFRVT